MTTDEERAPNGSVANEQDTCIDSRLSNVERRLDQIWLELNAQRLQRMPSDRLRPLVDRFSSVANLVALSISLLGLGFSVLALGMTSKSGVATTLGIIFLVLSVLYSVSLLVRENSAWKLLKKGEEGADDVAAAIRAMSLGGKELTDVGLKGVQAVLEKEVKTKAEDDIRKLERAKSTADNATDQK